jgi:hypothetical protein
VAKKRLAAADYVTLHPKTDPRDDIAIEIGDSKDLSVFQPQVKIMRWGNEVNLSARLVHDKEFLVVTGGDKITLAGQSQTVDIYEVKNKDHPDGATEFDITLFRPPTSNKIRFSLQSKGLEFHYQPPLTREWRVGDMHGRIARVTETDAYDADGEVVIHRPPHVVGSYVLYVAQRKPNVAGGQIYGNGRFGAIFRPRMIDAAGKETWGNLTIDKAAGLLTVEIPQAFLDAATYPIRHAAGLEFGYHPTSGGTAQGLGSGYIDALYHATPASGGTITKLSVYAYKNTSCVVRPVVYKDADNTVLATGAK